jgi:hypothetical protein
METNSDNRTVEDPPTLPSKPSGSNFALLVFVVGVLAFAGGSIFVLREENKGQAKTVMPVGAAAANPSLESVTPAAAAGIPSPVPIQTATQASAPPVTNIPPPEPSPPVAAAAKPERPPDWQARAMEKYPSLAVAGSPMNKRFVTAYRSLVSKNSEYLKNPLWPVLLADWCYEVNAADAAAAENHRHQIQEQQRRDAENLAALRARMAQAPKPQVAELSEEQKAKMAYPAQYGELPDDHRARARLLYAMDRARAAGTLTPELEFAYNQQLAALPSPMDRAVTAVRDAEEARNRKAYEDAQIRELRRIRMELESRR